MSENVYFHGIAHPPAESEGDERDFDKAELATIAERLSDTPVKDSHGGRGGTALKGWIGDDGALHYVGMLHGDDLAAKLIKTNVLSGVYNGNSLNQLVEFKPEGGRKGKGVIRRLGDPIDVSLVPMEDCSRGPYCKVVEVLTQSELDGITEERGGINMQDFGGGRESSKAVLARVIKSCLPRAIASDKQMSQQQDAKAAVTPPVVATPAAVVVPAAGQGAQPMDVDKTPPTQQQQTAGQAQTPPSKEEMTIVMTKMMDKMKGAEEEKKKLMQEIDQLRREASSSAPKEESVKERTKKLIANDYKSFVSHLNTVLKGMGKAGDKTDAKKILARLSDWAAAPTEAEKEKIVDELVESPTLVYAQACSAYELQLTEKLQEAERESAAHRKKSEEMQKMVEAMQASTFMKASAMLSTLDAAQKEVENACGVPERKRTRDEVSATPAEEYAPSASKRAATDFKKVEVAVPVPTKNILSPDTALYQKFCAFLDGK